MLLKVNSLRTLGAVQWPFSSGPSNLWCLRHNAGLKTAKVIFMLNHLANKWPRKFGALLVIMYNHHLQSSRWLHFRSQSRQVLHYQQYVSFQTHWPSQCIVFTASGGSSLVFESTQHLQLHSSDLTPDSLCLQSLLAALINFLSSNNSQFASGLFNSYQSLISSLFRYLRGFTPQKLKQRTCKIRGDWYRYSHICLLIELFPLLFFTYKDWTDLKSLLLHTLQLYVEYTVRALR